MANDGFNAYQKFTGGVLDSSNTGLITITLTQYKQLQNLSVSVGNVIMGHLLAVWNFTHLFFF